MSGSTDSLIIETETGARHPGGGAARLFLLVPLAWSLFQLWYASPLPFEFGFGVFNSTEARAIHLAFAVFLTFAVFPARKRSPRDRVPLLDWALAGVGAFAASYLYVFYEALSQRPGDPTTLDLVVGIVGLLVLLEATRRALGPPLTIIATVFLLYAVAGPHMPDAIAHKGVSLTKLISHQWLSTEGVYGVALGVSTSLVFLFVLFGALLERAGGGHYFIEVAFALLGHQRGGPAKAAVVSSAMTGMVSGSSIANVVTTGTFTIPLMKRVGFPAEKAGAVEVASSTNGQLTPPVMGAAAFLIMEYVGISLIEVIKHALLPAAIAYVALVYIVHLEACKAGMKGLPRRVERTKLQTAAAMLATLLGLILLSGAVYYGMGWIKDVAGDASAVIAGTLILIAYVALVRMSAGLPDLTLPDPGAAVVKLPEPGPTLRSGLYFLLPVVVLIWCLVVERLSPGLSAFWATVLMAFVVVTHRPLKAFFRGQGSLAAPIRRGGDDLLHGLVSGARNMIGIGVATASAGIVVGVVTQTGVGLVMTEFVEFISGGNLFLMLLFTAAICLILGMGLPTTANYMVVSSLMAPVIVALGTQHGLAVPLVAVHLFVFYFGILADDTPPVGLAAFAAAAISGGDPIRTGIQGFTYDIRTAVLPFLFIFNTELLLIGVESWGHLLVTVASALVAMLLFAAATQGWFLTRSRLWETAALLLIAFTLFRPGYWMDLAVPPLEALPAERILAVAEALPEGASLRLEATGETLEGDIESRSVLLPLGATGTGEARLSDAGLMLRFDGRTVVVDAVTFGSPAAESGLDFDWKITALLSEADRPPKQVFYIPALLLLGLVVLFQRRRAREAAHVP